MISSVIVPSLNGAFIDMLIVTTSVNEILKYAAIIIVIGLLGALASYFVNMSTAKLTAKTTFNMMSDTINHIQKIPYDTFTSKFNPAYLIQRISGDLSTMFTFFLNNFMSVFLQGVTFVVVAYIIATINIQIFFLSLLFLPIYLGCYMAIKKPLFTRNIELKENSNHYSKTMFEQINRIQEIKAEATFQKSIEIENRSFGQYLKSLISFSRLSYLFSSMDALIAVLFQSIVLVIGGIQIINGNLSIGEFTIVNTYFYMLLTSVKYYFNFGKSYQDYKSSSARMSEIMSIENEHNGNNKVKDINSIKVKDVKYAYVTPGPNVIDGITAEFRKGEVSLVTGPNGIGKTTLINVLLGILQNLKSGNVSYDDMDLSEIDLYSARQDEISTMIQRIDLPDSTVEEYLNDSLGLNKEEIIAMINLMGLDQMYFGENFDLSECWDSKINTLSGGEKQKVMLVKVLGKRKPVLILDEPSTGMDDIGIQYLLKYLQSTKKDNLTIVISHDLRFKDIADNVIVLG
jgi:ATP-binding cassette subfamily C protein